MTGDDQQLPPLRYALLTLAVIVGFLAGSVWLAVKVMGGGGLLSQILRGGGAVVGLFAVATVALGYLTARHESRIQDARNTDSEVPTPGPDDPVFHIVYDQGIPGCTRLDSHDGHLWFWKAVDRQDMSGAVWCRGVRPR